MRNTAFAWPNGKRAAVSLTFDDGRKSQVEVGIPILNRYGIKATFYIVPSWTRSSISDWRKAVASGHEIGNHTIHHPGTGNLIWARKRALENYTLDQMANELDAANAVIERLFGSRPVSFAYTCGQTSVGRGIGVKSYVPLVVQRFLVGRGWRDECTNDPGFCDLAHIMGMEFDGLSPEQIKALARRTADEGSWLVLCGHEIGRDGPKTTNVETLAAFCEYANDPQNGLWVAPVADIASYIASQRPADHTTRIVRPPGTVLLAMFYAGVISVVGVLSYLCFFIVQTRALAAILTGLLLFGVVMQLLSLVWWKRHGNIRQKGLLGIVCVLGYYYLRTWSSRLWCALRSQKNKRTP